MIGGVMGKIIERSVTGLTYFLGSVLLILAAIGAFSIGYWIASLFIQLTGW
jgi:hypothetical protein